MPVWKVRDVLTAITTLTLLAACFWTYLDIMGRQVGITGPAVSEGESRLVALVWGLTLGWLSQGYWASYCTERAREEEEEDRSL